ncbi:MAG: hypothetical protein K2X35_04555 [Bryobacteraceae bacterium]|nr:hypothetical protein [Bryobacteraceae bacterium]
MRFAPALLGVLLSASEAPPEDAVRRSAEAFSRNRQAARDYVYREDIRIGLRDPAAGFVPLDVRAYEVTLVKGAPFFRLVEAGGTAVPEAVARKEQSRLEQFSRDRRRGEPGRGRRFVLDYSTIAETHDTVFVGSHESGGRPCWVFDAVPMPGTRARSEHSQWLRVNRLRACIDRATLHPVRIDTWQGGSWKGAPHGTESSRVYHLVGAVWLPEWMELRQPRSPGAWNVTEQRYSNYRKFAAESAVRFAPPR